jgi:YqjK-like protein
MQDLDDIVRRKQRLIERCAVQRAAIAGAFRELERPIAVADRGLKIVRFFRSHPVLIGAAIAAIMVARGRTSLIGLLARGVSVWRLWRTIGTWAQRLGMDVSGTRRRGNAGHVAS